MSGIVGIWNLDGRPIDIALLRRMAEAAAYRGPDGIHYWTEGNIGFAHLALKTTPESLRERLPLANASGSYWITADARIDNRQELLSLLKKRGFLQSECPTDSELILAAYEAWGADCPKYLIGDFAFAIWDKSEKQLFCARDPLGLRPFYYRYENHGFFFASEVKQILAYPSVPAVLNEGMLGSYLCADSGYPDETFYEGINQLPMGHALIISSKGLRRWQYRGLLPEREIRYRTDEEYAEHFRHLFFEAVRCRLRSNTPVSITLSGGLDSSSVTAVAATLQKEGEFTKLLVAYHDAYRKCPAADEREYAKAVLEKYPMEIRWIEADNFWPLKDYPSAKPDSDDPFTVPQQQLFRAELSDAHARGISVMLTGEWGDALFQGSPFIYADLLLHLRLVRWGRALWRDHCLRRKPLHDLLIYYSIKPLIPTGLWQGLRRLKRRSLPRIPKWINPTFSARVDLPYRLKDTLLRCRSSERALRHRYETLVSSFISWIPKWMNRTGVQAGIELRHPFADIRLVDFALSIPSEQCFRNGLTKIILRNGMRGILPDSVRNRTDKASLTPLLNKALRERETLKARFLCQCPTLRQYGIVKPQVISEYYNLYKKGFLNCEYQLWLTFTAEIWLNNISSNLIKGALS